MSGTAHHTLAESVASALDAELAACGVERFPDGELRPVVERAGRRRLRGPAHRPPVDEHLVELLLLLDACRRCGALADVTVAATHGLLVDAAHERLGRLPIRRLFVTDTLPGCRERAPRVRVCSVAPLLADAIARLRDDEPLDALMVRG